MDLAIAIDPLPEELNELVGHHWVYLDLLHLTEGVGDVSLVLLEEYNLFFHHEIIWIRFLIIEFVAINQLEAKW